MGGPLFFLSNSGLHDGLSDMEGISNNQLNNAAFVVLVVEKKNHKQTKKKTIIKDNAHRYIKFPSLYCRNSINSSRSYLAMLHTKHEILKSSKLCLRSCSWKIPPLLNYKTDQKSYLSYIYRVFDTVWVKSCQSLNYNWGLKNCQIPTELKGRPTSIMVNMATEYVSTRARHSCKTRSFFIDWQRLKRLIIGQNL